MSTIPGSGTPESVPAEEPCQTPLAAHIPPLECDHKVALEILLQTPIREMTDADAEKMVRHYRELRRQDAARRIERDRKKIEAANKRNELAAKREAKAQERLDKAAAKSAKLQGGGEGSGQ